MNSFDIYPSWQLGESQRVLRGIQVGFLEEWNTLLEIYIHFLISSLRLFRKYGMHICGPYTRWNCNSSGYVYCNSFSQQKRTFVSVCADHEVVSIIWKPIFPPLCTQADLLPLSRRRYWLSCSYIMQVNNYAVMQSDTDLACSRSKELLFLLQVFSFGCQGLLLCVLLTPQVAGQKQTVAHCYTYVTKKPETQLQPWYKRKKKSGIKQPKSQCLKMSECKLNIIYRYLKRKKLKKVMSMHILYLNYF